MASSLEIQFKHKFAINIYIICISLGIISSLCFGCSGKYSLLVCFLTALVWPAFGIDVFTAPKLCPHERAQGWLGFSCRNDFVGKTIYAPVMKLSALSLLPAFYKHSKLDYLPWCFISTELDIWVSIIQIIQTKDNIVYECRHNSNIESKSCNIRK